MREETKILVRALVEPMDMERQHEAAAAAAKAPHSSIRHLTRGARHKYAEEASKAIYAVERPEPIRSRMGWIMITPACQQGLALPCVE